METTNRTKTNPFTAFGTPAKVFIDGNPVHESRIKYVLELYANNKEGIKSFVVSRINGVVKLYIVRNPARNILDRRFCFKKPQKEGAKV